MPLPILVYNHSASARLKTLFVRSGAWLPGASPWMILTHLALLNNLSAAELDALMHSRSAHRRQSFDRNLVRTPWLRQQITSHFEIPADVLRATRGIPARHPAAAFVEPTLRFCSLCLKQAVHSVVHQWTFMRLCPVHHVALTTACPACAQPIDYRLNPRSFIRPGRCPHCLHRLVTVAAIENLAANPPGSQIALSSFALRLSKHLRQCQERREIDALDSWFALFPSTLPPGNMANPSLIVFPANPSSGFYRPCRSVFSYEAERCYRSIRHCLWRQLSRPERRTLIRWARRHTGSLHAPVPSSLNVGQLALLFWRLLWESRSNPRALFRDSNALYSGLLTWLLFNPSDETAPPSSTLSADEIRALFNAFALTYVFCHHIAAKMRPKNQVAWHSAWLKPVFPNNTIRISA